VYPIAFPPLAEQQAIVARVDSLMAMIDELEQQVAERKEQAQMLMQAVLREAFAGGEGAEDVLPAAEAPSPLPLSRRARGSKASPLHEGEGGRRPGEGEVLPLVAEFPAAYNTRGQVALPAANQPVSGGIPARILAAMQPGREYSRADLLAATGISEADWIWAIRQLKEQGRVVQKGEKRGARYRLASAQE
jgi:type I restriction enzyme S subunit